MGLAYLELMQDPELLEVQMHGFAAATSDEDIARACRRTFQVLYQLLTERTDLDDEEVRQFFAAGMMISVMSAIDLLSLPDSWAQSLCPDPGKFEAATGRRGPSPAPSRRVRANGGPRMNPPLSVPLFLPRLASDHSQTNR